MRYMAHITSVETQMSSSISLNVCCNPKQSKIIVFESILEPKKIGTECPWQLPLKIQQARNSIHLESPAGQI